MSQNYSIKMMLTSPRWNHLSCLVTGTRLSRNSANLHVICSLTFSVSRPLQQIIQTRGEDLPSPIFLDVSLTLRTRLCGFADRLFAGSVLFCATPFIPGASRNQRGRIILRACYTMVEGNLMLEARQLAAEVALHNRLVKSTFVDLATSTSRRALLAGQR